MTRHLPPRRQSIGRQRPPDALSAAADPRRRGPQPAMQYERLNAGAKAKRRTLAQMSVVTLRDDVETVLWAEHRAGRLRHAKAIPALAHHGGLLLRHGAFARGIPEIASHTGVAPRTVIRASRDVRTRNLPRVDDKRSALLWRVKRGQKGEGVTVWNAGHALVDAVWKLRERRRSRAKALSQAKADRAELDAAIRDALSRNGSSTQCDTVAHVAAPWAAGRGEGGAAGRKAPPGTTPVAERTTPEPDISTRIGQCEHGRTARACLTCARSLVAAGTF